MVALVKENLGHIESRVKEMYDHQSDPAFIEDKLINLRESSRQNNLRIDGIKERPNEKKLDILFKESLGIEDEVVIERAHRLKADKNKKSNTPKTIICRILNY